MLYEKRVPLCCSRSHRGIAPKTAPRRCSTGFPKSILQIKNLKCLPMSNVLLNSCTKIMALGTHKYTSLIYMYSMLEMGGMPLLKTNINI